MNDLRFERVGELVQEFGGFDLYFGDVLVPKGVVNSELAKRLLELAVHKVDLAQLLSLLDDRKLLHSLNALLDEG